MQQLTVGRQSYCWSVQKQTKEFAPLARLGDSSELDVLRISSSDTRFDVAIRIDAGQYSDGVRHYLGPMLILDGQFPSAREKIQKSILIELRPKICSLKSDLPDAATVERIIQWVSSAHFRVERVNSSGGKWVDYGQ
jgi:hypothetical protein